MGRRGPPPKPTALRILEGNPSNRPLPENEPKPDPAPLQCEPPAFLNEFAKAEWRRAYPVLLNCGLMTKLDLSAFAAYCAAHGTWRQAEEALRTEPIVIPNARGGFKQNPWVKISRDAAAQALRLGELFGMTPSSRGRLGVHLLPLPRGNDTATEDASEHGAFAGLIGKSQNH